MRQMKQINFQKLIKLLNKHLSYRTKVCVHNESSVFGVFIFILQNRKKWSTFVNRCNQFKIQNIAWEQLFLCVLCVLKLIFRVWDNPSIWPNFNRMHNFVNIGRYFAPRTSFIEHNLQWIADDRWQTLSSVYLKATNLIQSACRMGVCVRLWHYYVYTQTMLHL